MAGYTRNDTSNNIATGNVINAADLDGEFDALVAAFHASTGHTHDGTAANGAPITKIGPAQDLVISTGAITPKTDNTVDLGSSSFEFKDLYIDGTANIDALVADTADINAGTIDGTAIGANSASTGAFTTLSASSTVTLSGGTADGVLYLNGSKVATSGSALTFDGTNLSLLPSGYSVFGASSSEQMRLTSTGLGIGTSSPFYKLHVEGTVAARFANPDVSGMIVQATTGTNAAAMTFNNTGGNAYVGLDSSNGSRIGGGAYTLSVWNEGNYGIAFGTNNTRRMTLDSSGNLGLGVTPSAWLSTVKAYQFSTSGALWGLSGQQNVFFSNNEYLNGSAASTYIATGYASRYQQIDGSHRWYTAPSGTAGNAITFTQAMTLDASGKLMVGDTSNQGEKLRVYDGSSTSIGIIASTTGVSYLNFGDTADANVGFIGYDHTNNFMNFRTNGTERARIDSSGNLLVGATATGSYFDSKANFYSPDTYAPFGGKQGGAAGATVGVFWHTATSGDNSFALFVTEASPTLRGSITYNRGGGLVAYNTTSDYRLKTVNGPIQNALEKIVALKPSTGRMNGAEQDIDFFVAHELQEVVPSAVTGEKDAVKEDGTPDYQMVDKSALIPLLTAAIQEQQALITSLTARVALLEGN